MSKKAFDKIMHGLKEARAYMEGERQDYKVTMSPAVDAEQHPEKLDTRQVNPDLKSVHARDHR